MDRRELLFNVGSINSWVYKHREDEGEVMSIWTVLFIILLIAWLGGFTVFHVASGLIHLLLVFAIISLILHFVMGRRAV